MTAPTAPQPVLRLSGISKSFPGVRALSDVQLDLYAGQVTALIGENGAGKSTIVKVLTGIYQPDAGTITVDGAEMRFDTADAAARAGVENATVHDLRAAAGTEAERIGQDAQKFLGHRRRFAGWHAAGDADLRFRHRHRSSGRD